ncbi:hypothetical protein F5Y08DRAFT_321254 [Xylaria arbuscula]|nr:hypothetical protein F5Y08DRAFT_321254 [Xylaria arbuscula]
MDMHEESSSCLSADPHDDNVKDPVLHYFGCLEAWQRETFFNATSQYWVSEVEKLESIGASRSEAEAKVEAQRESCQKRCAEELHRVSLILNSFARDDKQAYLLKDIASSRTYWQSTMNYKYGVERLRKWRTDRGLPNGATFSSPDNTTKELYNPDSNIKVQVIAFDEGIPCNIDSPHVTGTFPNQATSVYELLQRDTPGLFNLLKQKRDESSATGPIWIHIPSNNMLWVEEAISLYYGEKQPSREQMRYGDDESRSSGLLRDYFWRGQEYGDSTNPKSRFMRPFCEFIAPTRRHAKSEADKVVLFAPYLHWETSRQASFVTRKAREVAAEHTQNQQRKAYAEKQRRVKDRGGLKAPTRAARRLFLSKAVPDRLKSEVVELGGHGDKRYQSKNPLGQYLLDAARLYEEIRNYQDTSMIQRYLFTDPPLHTRRSLDQGYYTMTQSTRSKDRTQVLYRATTPAKSSSHQFHRSTGEWTCYYNDLSMEGCEICRENLRKISSVVMVDQLWMWVLDPKLVITCFPKRYGLHDRDPSGVFEAVQKRLVRDRPIRSVFAISQTILDECSDTLFRRMKDRNTQPPVLDLFSEAIQDVSRKQVVETHRLWNWIDRARRINRQQEPHQNLDIPSWTMSAEGDLECEIQGIVEELEIMIALKKTQLDVYRKFIQHASRLLEDESSGYWCSDGEALWFGPRLLAKVEERIGYLESLHKSASNAANLVKDLSQLRQQQDSVIQALQSVRLSLDSIDQGRTIMVFTIVTIVFSPLSFLSSIFGMNNAEFGDNNWKVADQLKLILLISAGVTALALIFASRRVRAAGILIGSGIAHPSRTWRQILRLIGHAF